MPSLNEKSIEELSTAPFLRWAGGKTWLSRRVSDLIGELSYRVYHEPFLGGGSIFFRLAAGTKAQLSDANAELIEAYCTLRDKPDAIIEELSKYKNEAEFYYKVRSENPACEVRRAARFIYLNQTSFNGIYRVNLNGVYNVPYGHRKKNFLDEPTLRSASAALKKATLFSGDFEETLKNVKEGDLVFIDPPYTVSHNMNGFIKYNQSLFSLEDQYRLKEYVLAVAAKGASYLLTNAAHQKVREIFAACPTVVELQRANLIGGKLAQRGQVSELLFTNLDLNDDATQPRQLQ